MKLKNYWKIFRFVSSRDLKSIEKQPKILCPTCFNGHLEAIDSNLIIKETEESSKGKNDYEDVWDPCWTEYRFTLALKCSDRDCKDFVICIGIGNVEETLVYNDDFGPYDSYDICLYPKYFIPELKIIPIKDVYPETLNQELLKSFSHFFSDLSSCANKIRQCVEILMDELKVSKTILTEKRKKKSCLFMLV